MKKIIINTLKRWWSNFNMSSEEIYLSKAADHVDLEHRMKIIMNHNYYHLDPIFNNANMGKNRYY